MFSFFREKELVQRAKELKVNGGIDPSADIGPVISKEVQTFLCFLKVLNCLFFHAI